MGMVGEYVRLPATLLDRVVGDPEWAEDWADTQIEHTLEWDGPRDPAKARSLDVDKAWHAIWFLLNRVGFPVDIVNGEEEIPGAEEWGYTPPRYITAERVRVAAEALAGLPGSVLVDGVDRMELVRADIYLTHVWETDENCFDYVIANYEPLVPFFQAAAKDGDAMLVWLS